MNIGKSLKDIRKHKGFSQKDLARKIDISQASLSQIESGITKPSSSTLQKLSAELEVPEALIYIMSTDISDVPPEKRALYETLFPMIKSMILQIAGKNI